MIKHLYRSHLLFRLFIFEWADLGILHQVAFHSQPGVFRQEAENFCPLTLRHPKASRLVCESHIDPSGAWLFGEVKPDSVHLLGGKWVLNASGNSWIRGIESFSVWTALFHLDLIEDMRNGLQWGKLSKSWTWTSVAMENPAARMESRSKIFIVFLSRRIQSERPYATLLGRLMRASDKKLIQLWLLIATAIMSTLLCPGRQLKYISSLNYQRHLSKHCSSAELPWHHNIKLSFRSSSFFLSLCISVYLFFVFFVWTER